MSSVAFTMPLLSASVVISTVGATPPLGATVSKLAVSDVLVGELLPAASCTLTVTVNEPFSAGLLNVVVAKPLAMSVAVSTTVETTGVLLPSVKTSLSPATTLVLSKLPLTVKVVALLSSVLLTTPSLLVSVVISTVGATPPLGATVSKLAVSDALTAELLPAAS